MLQAQNVTIAHAGHTFIDNVNFAIDSKAKKRIGLLGANGTGKSSLLKVLAGIDDPAHGNISMTREVIGYVPQELHIPEDVEIGAYMETLLEESWMSYRILMVLDEVGLPETIQQQKIVDISGGQRVRLSIAIALLAEPTILLLDEPTNHLDQQGLEWLGSYIQNFSGTIMMITHDRAFINSYITELWEIDLQYKQIERYTGNYDDFLQQKEARFEIALRDYERYQTQIDDATLWLKENEFHPKFRFSDRVMAKKKVLEELIEQCPPKPILRKSVKFHKVDTLTEQRLLTLKIDEKPLGDKVLLRRQEVIVRAGDRMRISGPNGSGKTTLLRILSGEDKDFVGTYDAAPHMRLAFLHQGVMLPQQEKLLSYILDTVPGDQATLRRMLARYLFTERQMDQSISKLSFGEQKRLELAILLQHKPNVLLLDEPTNHLDIFAREDLEKFLLDEVSTLIYITHDSYFAEKVGCTREITLAV